MVHLDKKDSARSPREANHVVVASYRRDRWMRVHPGAYRWETRSPEHRTATDRHPGPRDGMIGYDWIRDDRVTHYTTNPEAFDMLIICTLTPVVTTQWAPLLRRGHIWGIYGRDVQVSAERAPTLRPSHHAPYHEDTACPRTRLMPFITYSRESHGFLARPSPNPSSAHPPSLGADTSVGPMPPRTSRTHRHQVDILTWDHTMSAGDEDDTSGGVSDTNEMAVDPMRDEEEGRKYIPDGHISMSDGMCSQTLDANASEEDDLQADNHQDDRVDDDEEGDELRSADDGEGGVMDLAMCRLACDPDVSLPLNGLVSPFPLEGHTYVPGTMDYLISVTCYLAQNFASQGWATKEGASKSQIPLQDVLGVMYGSVDVFSWRTVAWEPVSVEEGDLNHLPGTSRPDMRASATQGVVKPDRAMANHAPRAPGKDEVLWELVYFFDNMDNPAGTPCKETGDPHFTRQHLVVMFMDLILFAHGMAAPRACLPLRGYEALAPSLTVPRPMQFFQGIAEQGDIGVYGRSGMFQSWGKAQRGAWFAVLSQRPGPKARSRVRACSLSAQSRLRSAFASATWAFSAGFPTRTDLAVDPGIQAYIADPQPPSPACTTAGEAHASPHSAVGVSEPQLASMPPCPPHTPLRVGRSPVLSRPSVGTSTPQRRDRTAPPPTPTGPSSAGCPACDAVPLWLPMGWPNVHIPDVPDPLLSSPAPTPRLRPTWGWTCVVELPPPRHTRSPLLAHHLSKQACSASRGPPGEDTQAVRLTLLHVVQRAVRSGGLSLGEHVTCPMGFRPPGRRRPALAAPVGTHPDIVGSDHRGVIVNMYLELSRMEWWALSDWREVLSEWCKGASMPV
ncbi:hypothetical protein K439DRAFT_1623395 [Ramaria rubella]|nr:hypothetical protein K439DRAFT_1623395 [Ramaria rubella]